MSKSSTMWAFAVIVVGAGAALSTWHFEARELRRCQIDTGLAPVAALLLKNQEIRGALAADGYSGTEAAIIERYLADIRRDGVPKHAATQRKLDALIDNNTVIVALLANGAASARTSQLKVQAQQYRDYAKSLRDRWHSTFEVFMAGGNLPAAGPERPSGIAAAVNGEIAAQ